MEENPLTDLSEASIKSREDLVPKKELTIVQVHCPVFKDKKIRQSGKRRQCMLKEQTKRPIITIKREQTLEMSQNSYLVQVVKKVNEKKNTR